MKLNIAVRVKDGKVNELLEIYSPEVNASLPFIHDLRNEKFLGIRNQIELRTNSTFEKDNSFLSERSLKNLKANFMPYGEGFYEIRWNNIHFIGPYKPAMILDERDGTSIELIETEVTATDDRNTFVCEFVYHGEKYQFTLPYYNLNYRRIFGIKPVKIHPKADEMELYTEAEGELLKQYGYEPWFGEGYQEDNLYVTNGVSSIHKNLTTGVWYSTYNEFCGNGLRGAIDRNIWHQQNPDAYPYYDEF